jgi:hypothetical protein
MKPNHCAIVTEEGEDAYGRTSGVIAPHGICALWEANDKEIKQSWSYRTVAEPNSLIIAVRSLEIR